MIKYWRKFVGVMVFLPNAMPLSAVLRTEIFPWALLFSLYRQMKVNKAYILFALYLLLSGLVLGNLSNPLLPIRSLLAILNATLVFFAMLNLHDQERKWVVKALFAWLIIQVVVASLQFIDLFPAFLVGPIRFFIERFNPNAYGFGRGVTGLFAEPSYLGLAIHYFAGFLFFYKRIVYNSLGGIVLLLALFLVNVVLVRSVTGLVFFLLLLAAMPPPRKLLRLMPVGVGAIVLLAVLGPMLGDNLPRALQFVVLFEKARQSGEAWMFLLTESGLRLVGILSAYWYGWVHPLGSGLGNWGPASLEAMAQLGLSTTDIELLLLTSDTFIGIRPTSFASSLFLETGFVGFFLFAWAVYRYIPWKAGWNDPYFRPVMVLFLFNIFFLGSVGDPIPWAVLGLCVILWQKRQAVHECSEPQNVANNS